MSAMKFREPNQVKWVGIRPAHNGTQILAKANADNGNTVVYTVPTGKTLYLVHIAVGIYTNVTGDWYVTIRDSSAVELIYPHIGVNIANQPAEHAVATYWPPIEMSAGYDVMVHSGATGLKVWCSIIGWLE